MSKLCQIRIGTPLKDTAKRRAQGTGVSLQTWLEKWISEGLARDGKHMSELRDKRNKILGIK